MANEFKIKNGLLVSGSITGVTESGADNSAKMASTSWVRTHVAANAGSISSTKTLESFTATAGQTSFTITNGYTPGLLDIYLNGSFLNSSEYTATDGSAVVLTNAATVDDIVDVVKTSAFYVGTSPNARESYLYTATASQTTFAATYTPGQVDVFYNGAKLAPAEFTATNGTSVVLTTAATSGDVVEIMGWLTGGGLTGTRTLTINGTSYDLSANRSWTVTDDTKLPLSGGTLTGALVGTTVTLSSSLTFTSLYGGSINGFDGTSLVPMKYHASLHQWYGDGSLKMVMLGNGNLLLGTVGPDPGYRLDVNGTARIVGAATFSSSVTAVGTIFANTPFNNNLLSVNDVTNVANGFNLLGSGSYWGIRTLTGGHFSLDVYNGGSPKSAFYITNSGNIQIGYTGTPAGSGKLFISRNDQYGMTLDAASGYGRISTNDDYLYLRAGALDRLTIVSSSGNVGINTTSPIANLHVFATNGNGVAIGQNSTTTQISANLFLYPSNITSSKRNWAITTFYDRSELLQFRRSSTTTSNPYDNGVTLMTLDGINDRIGIGLINPQTQLHINGVLTFTEAGYDTVRKHNISHGHSDGNGANNYISFQVSDGSGNTAERFRTDGNGNLIHKSYSVGQGILWNYSGGATYGFYNAGNGTFVLTNSGVANVGSFNMSSGAYTATSDINKKKDFEHSTIGLAEIMQLKPTLFRYKVDSNDSTKDLGFIAQEVKDYIPQAYVENGEFIGLTDRPILAAAIKAIQELKAENDQLKDILTRNNIN